MIAQLRGTIVQTDNQQTILDVQGVGYAVNISGRTQGQLGTMAGEVTLLTEMQVREDNMTLFGFLDLAKRIAFSQIKKAKQGHAVFANLHFG